MEEHIKTLVLIASGRYDETSSEQAHSIRYFLIGSPDGGGNGILTEDKRGAVTEALIE